MEISDIIKRLETVEAELAEAKAVAQRADDYRQVVNAMMRHIYGYYYHMEEEELDKYWSARQRDTMAYAHSDIAYYGFDGVYKYYVEGTNGSKAEARKICEAVYGLHYEGNAAPGYRVMHILGSPYVEIAGDRKTAQGVWMAFSTMSRMNKDGKAEPLSIIQRFSGEFVNENGVWKIWHVRDYEDFVLDLWKIAKDLDAGPGGIPAVKPYSTPEEKKAGGMVDLELKSIKQYQPWSVTEIEPHLPDPYETWEEATPFLKIVNQDA